MKSLTLESFNALVSFKPSLLETARIHYDRPSSKGPMIVLEHEDTNGWLSQYRIDGRSVKSIAKALEKKQLAYARITADMHKRGLGRDVWTGR